MELVRFLIIGLGVGAIYALAAHGIVLVYRGSGILNFAHGAIGLVAARVFVGLRPGSGTALAAVVALVVAASLGAAIQLLIMRPLREASPLVRLIATLGILTIIQQAVLLRYAENPFVEAVLPSQTVRLTDELTVSADRFWLVAIAVVVTAVLWCAYRFTPFGRATTAVAENETATAALGWSPDLIATINWALGATLAGVAGILLAPITNVDAVALTLIVLPALAAALVGAFSSFPLTLLGGLAIGVAEAVMQRYVRTPGWPSAAPLLVVIAVLVLRGRALPLRSHIVEHLPRLGDGTVRRPVVAVVALVAFVSVLIGSVTLGDAITTTVIAAFVLLSIVVVTGYAGQVSLAQYALAGVGALISSRAADAWGWPFAAAAVLGVLATVPVGLVIALPALRTRGVNLAIATLGLGVTIDKLVLSNKDLTGGHIRGTVVEPPTVFGWSLDSVAHPERYAIFVIGAFTVAALAVANLRRSRVGRRLVAVRTNERAAASLGVGVVGAKLYAFGLGAALAAAGGVLLAFRFEHVQFGGYDVLASINAVVLAVVGGVGFIPGAIVGGAMAAGGLAPYVVDRIVDIGRYVGLVGGALLLLTLLTSPQGVAGAAAEALASAGRLAARLRRPADVVLARGAAPRVAPASLVLNDVTVRFGGVIAVAGVSFRVEPGEVVGLIGPNGAGKTSIIDAVSGFQRCEGSVHLDSIRMDRWSAVRRTRAGVGRSFQSLELFEDMTVLDNLRTASDRRDRGGYVTSLLWAREEPLPPLAVMALDEFGLAADLHRRPRELSYGRRHLVSLARAVAAGPSVLLLDEPTAGLDQAETARIGGLIRRLAVDWGMAVLLVEHDVELVMTACDRIVALEFGAVIAEGSPEQVRTDPLVRAAYLGEDEVDPTMVTS